MKTEEYINMLTNRSMEYITCRIIFDSFDLTNNIPQESKASYLQLKQEQINDSNFISQLMLITKNITNNNGDNLGDYILLLNDLVLDINIVKNALIDSYNKQLG